MWYGHVIHIFHVYFLHVGPRSKSSKFQRMDLCFVRWYGRDTRIRDGWQAKRPPRVGFVDCKDPGAFGFVHPDDILRAAHIIPAFELGTTKEFLPPSKARLETEGDEDYVSYYINM